MPILSAEPSCYPENLLEDPAAVNSDAVWWVLKTRPRQEKQLMRKLLQHEVSFYCPIAEKKYRSPAGRQRTTHLPLFSNYVFLFGDHEARIASFETNTVAQCLEVVDQQQLQNDLQQIELLINQGGEVTLESKIKAGDPVRVLSGPMRGLVGKVFQRKGKQRLVVTINFLQDGASVELQDWEVEKF